MTEPGAIPRASRLREPRVLILGLPYFGQSLAQGLASRGWDARFLHHPGRSPARWARVAAALRWTGVLYLLGSRAERWSPQDLLFRAYGKPIVIHWVGTDALIATEQHARGPLARSVVHKPSHWCDAPWLVDELRQLGIPAEFVSLPVTGLASAAPPLPSRFRVLLYLPVDGFDREVFDMEALLKLPGAFPDVDFVLVPSPASTLPGPLAPNLEAPGWVFDMDALYRSVSVTVRLTSHDGMSFMVLESLSRGRYVIYTYALPGVIKAEGYEAVAAALTGLVARHEAGLLGLNEAGMAWAREHFDPSRALDEIDGRLRALIRPRP
ncbi:MAG: hypothetical protein ACKVT1_03410 [Dehalococcoidia bacterium]